MTWTNPTTVTTGDNISAAKYNNEVVNNSLFLYNAPTARVYNNAAISITNATETALTFNSERYDTDGIHDTGINTGRLTCQTAGKYHIYANLQFAQNTTGVRYAYLRLNGTTKIAVQRMPNDAGVAINGVNAGSFCISTTYQLAAADYVEVVVYQNSTVALNVESDGNWSPEFGMDWIGA